MDGGPFRVPRQTDRSAVNRQGSTHRQAESLQSSDEDSRGAASAPVARYAPEKGKSPKRFILPFVIALVVIILGVAGWFLWSKVQAEDASAIEIDSSKYQAVFFTNGQVYFGKLQQSGDEYLKLTDIYYLQSQGSTEGEKDSKNPQEASTEQGNVQLIKLGDEIHGPEDKMIISKDQVLFYEDLKSNGKVAQSIEKSKQ